MNDNDGAFSTCGLQLLTLLNSHHLDKGATLYSLMDGAKFNGLARIRLPSDHSVELYSLLEPVHNLSE